MDKKGNRYEYVGGVRPQTTLHYLRKAVRITQAQLGQLTDINQTTISDYEHGLAIPTQHADRLYRVLRDLLPFEQRTVMDGMTPADLPRPWESITRREYADGTRNQHADSTLVA